MLNHNELSTASAALAGAQPARKAWLAPAVQVHDVENLTQGNGAFGSDGTGGSS